MAVSPCISKADPRGRELVRHGTVLFPAACYHDDLTRDAIPWHWHTELEAGIVTEGAAVVAAGTERLVLERGMGFFITSGVLHTVLTRGGPECRLHSAVFHPRLVGSGADSIFWQNYIQPLLAEDAPKCVLLDGGEPWHSEALRAIAAAWDACAEELPGYDLRMRENLSQLAFLLCRHRLERGRGGGPVRLPGRQLFCQDLPAAQRPHPLGIPQGARLRLTGGMPARSRSKTAARSLQTPGGC